MVSDNTTTRAFVRPEIMLLGDDTLSRLSWTLDQETDRLVSLVAEHAEIEAMLARNGWTTRMLAWGHVINGLLDQLGFDDEKGRA